MAKAGDTWIEPRGFYGKNDRSRFDYEPPTTYLVLGRHATHEDPTGMTWTIWDVLVTDKDGNTSIECYYCDDWEENEFFEKLS